MQNLCHGDAFAMGQFRQQRIPREFELRNDNASLGYHDKRTPLLQLANVGANQLMLASATEHADFAEQSEYHERVVTTLAGPLMTASKGVKTRGVAAATLDERAVIAAAALLDAVGRGGEVFERTKLSLLGNRKQRPVSKEASRARGRIQRPDRHAAARRRMPDLGRKS